MFGFDEIGGGGRIPLIAALPQHHIAPSQNPSVTLSEVRKDVVEDNSEGECCDHACMGITEPKSWGFSPIQ